MKLSPEDPMMTAHALGELCEFDAARISIALEADAVLAQESDSISEMAGLLSETLGARKYTLGEKRREVIFKSGQRPDAGELVLEHKKRARRQSVMAVVGVAAVVTAGFVGLSNLGVDSVGPGSSTASGEGQGGSSGSSERDLPMLSNFSTDLIRNVEELTLKLPLALKVADPSMVETTLIESGKLPSTEHFRVENWVNILQAEAKPQVQIGPVGVSTELGPCPWDSQKALLLVHLQSGDHPQENVRAEISFDPKRVETVRLVGESFESQNPGGDGGILVGNQSFFYEVKLTHFEGKLGQINLELNQNLETARSGMLPLGAVVREQDELSNDFRVALTLARFARYGRTEDGEFSRIAAEARDLLGSVRNAQNHFALDVVLLAEERLESLKR